MNNRIRVLCSSADSLIEGALSQIPWRGNEQVYKDLDDARELLCCILSSLGDEEDPEELDF